MKSHKNEVVKPKKTSRSLTGLLRQHQTLQDEVEEADRVEKARNEAPPFTNKALYCLSPENWFRKATIAIVYNKKFTGFIIFCIVLNCIFLAIGNPACQKLTSASAVEAAVATGKCAEQDIQIFIVSEIAGWVFTGIFTLECVLKILAQGLIMDEYTYLRDGWNWLDFFVVVIAWISVLPGVSNLSSLRTFRVLRPLRTLTTIPGMKTIIKSVLSSCNQLANVLMLWIFVFMLFGIVGLQLFSGLFAGRCYLVTPNGTGLGQPLFELDEIDTNLCGLATATGVGCDSRSTTCKPVYDTRQCTDVWYGTAEMRGESGMSSRVCMRAPQSEKPDFGFSNFDNIFYGALTVFTSITLEGWVNVMYNLQDTFGRDYVVIPYFIFLILFGSYFLVNLALAVIWQEYDNTSKAEKETKLKEEMLQQASETEEQTKERNKAKDPIEGKAICKICNKVTDVVQHQAFETVITVFIILNTVGLAMDVHPMPSDLEYFLTIANIIFSSIFFLEMVLKLIGLGPKAYVQDPFNLFDAFVVILSLVEMILVYGVGISAAGLSVFRTFRLFRVFKLIRSWTSLRILMTLILNSLVKVSTAGILLIIVMFIFALLGMQLYAGEFVPPMFEEKPRAHFDNLFWSFVSVFQVLTGENWNEVLYNAMKVNGWVAVLFFLMLTFVGNYIIFNLFLAILLEQFDASDGENKDDSSKKSTAKVAPSPSKLKRSNTAAQEPSAKITPASTPEKTKVSSRRSTSPSGTPKKRKASRPPKGNALFILSEQNSFRFMIFKFQQNKWFDRFILVLIGLSSILLALDEPYLRTCSTEGCVSLKGFMEVADFVITFLFIMEMLLKWIALGVILHPGSYARDYWNNLDGVLVILSIVGMILSPPFVKVAAGSAAGNNKGTLKALRSLRALRGLRPLRVVRRYPGLKLVVNSIIRAIPKIANVVFVTLFFLLIFAIVGLQNYKGQMNSCNDALIDSKEECVGTFQLIGETCKLLPTLKLEQVCYRSANGTSFDRIWAPLSYNFDNIGNSMCTVFEITSGEMWPDIMYDVVDTAGIDKPAIPENRPAAALIFIAMIFFCSFLMFNVFVGVVIDNFNKMKEEQEGMDMLTSGQRKWRQTMMHTLRTNPMSVLRPPLGASKFKLKMFTLVESKGFELGILSCILVNVLVMALRYDGMSRELEVVLDIVNYVFVVIFTSEAIMKIYGIGFSRYVNLAWNRFDFGLVILSYVGIIGGGSLGSITTLFRIVRTARLFRLIKMSRGLTDLFNTLMIALPQVANVMTLLMLVFFIFAVIGMNLFSSVRLNGGLNEHANFQSFGSSMLLLFRMSTGESYNEIMHNLQIAAPYCSEEDGNCGPEGLPVIYCICFFTMSSFVLLNLLVAIVIEAFTTITELNNGTVRPEHTAAFKEIWAEYDPDGDSMVPTSDIIELMMKVNYPLGVVTNRQVPEAAVRKDIEGMFLEKRKNNSFVLPVFHHPPHGEANFHEFLSALVNRAMGDMQGDEEVEHISGALTVEVSKRTADTYAKNQRASTPRQARRKSKAELKVEFEEMRSYYIGEVFAVSRIQKRWRQFQAGKRKKLATEAPENEQPKQEN
jgi:hypothetical protein